MIEFIIYGTDNKGVRYPYNRGMTTYCLQEVVIAYRKKYPNVCHVNVDVALDMNTVPFNGER